MGAVGGCSSTSLAYVFSSNFQPSISYWLYGTVTGITGIRMRVGEWYSRKWDRDLVSNEQQLSEQACLSPGLPAHAFPRYHVGGMHVDHLRVRRAGNCEQCVSCVPCHAHDECCTVCAHCCTWIAQVVGCKWVVVFVGLRCNIRDIFQAICCFSHHVSSGSSLVHLFCSLSIESSVYVKTIVVCRSSVRRCCRRVGVGRASAHAPRTRCRRDAHSFQTSAWFCVRQWSVGAHVVSGVCVSFQ